MSKSWLFCINEEVIRKIVTGIWGRRSRRVIKVVRKVVVGIWSLGVLI